MEDHASARPPTDRAAQESRLGQRGLVVWLYGLSGSGKSTLAVALDQKLRAEGKATVLLDGDRLRQGLNQGLGFTDADRTENIRRAAEVARLFAQTGIITLCSFITPRQALRDLARTIVGAPDFLEVYVACSYAECARRDVKGLYAKAAAGAIPHFTGRDSAFEPPAAPDLLINTEQAPMEACLDTLHQAVKARVCR